MPSRKKSSSVKSIKFSSLPKPKVSQSKVTKSVVGYQDSDSESFTQSSHQESKRQRKSSAPVSTKKQMKSTKKTTQHFQIKGFKLDRMGKPIYMGEVTHSKCNGKETKTIKQELTAKQIAEKQEFFQALLKFYERKLPELDSFIRVLY